MKENRVEVVVVALLAAFLAWLWFANRSQGAGTGLEGFPSLGGPGGGLTLGGSTGPTFNFGGLGGATSPAGGGNCGCATCNEPGGSVAFGTPDELVQWLSGLNFNSLQNATQPGGFN